MLCAGTIVLSMLPDTVTSLRRLMVLVDVSCQTWAVPAITKFARFTVSAELVCNCLLITITVNAPSEERMAAKEETRSTFVETPSETLVSPKVDLLPS